MTCRQDTRSDIAAAHMNLFEAVAAKNNTMYDAFPSAPGLIGIGSFHDIILASDNAIDIKYTDNTSLLSMQSLSEIDLQRLTLDMENKQVGNLMPKLDTSYINQSCSSHD